MNRGIHEFSVQAVKNFNAFVDWNYEVLDLGTALGGYKSSAYITQTNPAKQVLIYPVPGQTVADGDNLYLYLNDTITQYFQADGSTPNLINETFGVSDGTLTVDYGTAFTAGDVILMGEELVYVSEVDGEDLTVIRGYGTSVDVAHANNTILWKVGTPGNHTATASVNPVMKIGVDDLPFKFSGIFMTGLNIWNDGAEGSANDDISILSFH